jgi:hypothetical protein
LGGYWTELGDASDPGVPCLIEYCVALEWVNDDQGGIGLSSFAVSFHVSLCLLVFLLSLFLFEHSSSFGYNKRGGFIALR